MVIHVTLDIGAFIKAGIDFSSFTETLQSDWLKGYFMGGNLSALTDQELSVARFFGLSVSVLTENVLRIVVVL